VLVHTAPSVELIEPVAEIPHVFRALRATGEPIGGCDSAIRSHLEVLAFGDPVSARLREDRLVADMLD
jgi:hypothetical protein